MDNSNPFLSASFGAKGPFQTAKSCLSSALASSKDASGKAGESSFAAFGSVKTDLHEHQASQDLQSEAYISESDGSTCESVSSATDSRSDSEEEYLCLDTMSVTNNTLEHDASRKEEIPQAISSSQASTSNEGFNLAIKEMNALVEDVTQSFQRLKKITTAFNSRKDSAQTIVPIQEMGGKLGEVPVIRTGGASNYFNFYYSGASEKQSGEGVSPAVGTKKVSNLEHPNKPFSSSCIDKSLTSSGSEIQKETAQVAEKSKTIETPKDNSGVKNDTSEGKKAELVQDSALAAKSKPFSLANSNPFDGKQSGSSLFEKSSSQPFPALSTVDNTKKADTDTEYPFQAGMSGSWKCWRCMNSMSSDSIVSKLGLQSADLVGKSYFLIGCGSNQCLGAKRRYFFIPTGKDPILHKDVQQTPNLPVSSDQKDTKNDFGSQPFTIPKSPGTPFGSVQPNSATASAFSASSDGANASKQEANSFFMQNTPQAPAQVQSSNPFLAARSSFAQQDQPNAAAPQFGVRSTISSSFNTQPQSNNTPSSGPVFGNSRFQNFNNDSSWGNAPSSNSLWGQSNANSGSGTAPTQQFNQNPNAPLNPFARPSAFSNM
ncbi:hypothetical protein XU18_2795 [Perkinsela sp. CCAP 1560/4]|nr:hypothetical protein XU18_2795 [Perkinsela sp. CCAP 1560/4]|eukprot:KNH06290.1 hypothetical protein XU18_2795 [Perkinsela sp. CCAP 1560/4]